MEELCSVDEKEVNWRENSYCFCEERKILPNDDGRIDFESESKRKLMSSLGAYYINAKDTFRSFTGDITLTDRNGKSVTSIDKQYLRRLLEFSRRNVIKGTPAFSFNVDSPYTRQNAEGCVSSSSRVDDDCLVDRNAVSSSEESILEEVMENLYTNSKKVALSEDGKSASNESSSSSIARSNINSPKPLNSLPASGVLQCVWKEEKPHFVFSIDDAKLVFAASMSKSGGSNSSMDGVYLFYTGVPWKKSGDLIIGKMTVSSSFTVSSDHSTVLEREFVLFADPEIAVGNPVFSARKTKGVSKKVADAFNVSSSARKRRYSKFCGANTLPNQWLQEQTEDDARCSQGINLEEEKLPANLQLVAVVARDDISGGDAENLGGWGLTFLKNKLDKPLPRASSKSVHVILPAGVHGGPRSANGGPSSLIERWRCGGGCDCGGWDLGCPLAILEGRNLSASFELFSQDGAWAMRVGTQEVGVYTVSFEANVAPLQAFAVAVAHIHSESRVLRPIN